MLIDEENSFKNSTHFHVKKPNHFQKLNRMQFLQPEKNVYLCKSYNPTPSY